MAAIKKSQFKINNGTDWDTYHFETDSAQTKHKKSDGTETTVEEVLNSALMPSKRTIRAIGMGYDGAIYVCFPLPAKYDKTPTVTGMSGGVTGFATADDCKVVLDTARTDGQTLCFKITSTKGAAVTANRPYICMVSFTIS
ncbi:hypothetical protein [Blautia sp.]|uniref:hypothetical protein n=1 Tax=Blautia sp. TaxID=1955243 RepID=UPI003AB5C874